MQHIIEFEYCNTCKYNKRDENDYPCCECLTEPAKEDGKKPVFWEEDKTTIKKDKRGKKG